MKLTPTVLVVVEAGTEHVTPAGAATTPHVSVTVPMKPFRDLACTVHVAARALLRSTLPTVIELSEKSVVFNCTWLLVRTTPSADPLIWKMVVCSGVTPAVVPTVTVVLPPAPTIAGLAMQVMPAARFAQPMETGVFKPPG